MIEKQFSIDGVMRTFLCYTKCPDYAGIEMQEIVNSSLDKANELIDFAYTSYSKANPSLIRPNLYVYIRKDMLKEINAFTDGKDIYLSVVATFGMINYVHERLNTKRINGNRLVPEGLENHTSVEMYSRIIELIVAHELTHIWDGHNQWMQKAVFCETESPALLHDVILREQVQNSEQCEDGITKKVNNLVVIPGGVLCEDILDVRYVQQILEIDADRGAIAIVLQKLHHDLRPHMLKMFNNKNRDAKQLSATMHMHGYELGMVIGAAGLMFGFFDRERGVTSFDSLKHLLGSDHPIPAIRFFEMDMCLLGFVGGMYQDKAIMDVLMSEVNAFVFDIFAHNETGMSVDNCFWAPAMTFEAQNFITFLDKGWNAIRDTLQLYAMIPIREKFTPNELEVFKDCVRYDKTGRPIKS